MKSSLARELLEGWWWPRICHALQEGGGTISILELEAKLDDIREAMKRDALPLDMEQVDPPESELTALDELTFVRQLRTVGIGSNRLQYAKRDYYRAFIGGARHCRESARARRGLDKVATGGVFTACHPILPARPGRDRKSPIVVPQTGRAILSGGHQGCVAILSRRDRWHFLTLKRFNEARTRLRKLEREYADVSAMTREVSNSANSLLQEARRVRLLPSDMGATDVERVMELLRQASAPRPVDMSSIDDPTADLNELEDRRRHLRGQLQELREEIGDVERLNREASDFEKEAKEQEARLASIGLIKDADSSADICPLCESHLAVAVPSVVQIRQSLSGIETQLASVRRDSPRLQGRLASLEVRRTEIEEQLRTAQGDLAARIRDNERLRIQRNTRRIEVDSDSASFSMAIENIPSDNPKTGRITALSVIAYLRKLDRRCG
jgi:hypothetical protein